MNMDQLKRNVDVQKPVFTTAELEYLTDVAAEGAGVLDDPRLLALMQEKGIAFDQGVVEIVDENGKEWGLVTKRGDDFGRLIERLGDYAKSFYDPEDREGIGSRNLL